MGSKQPANGRRVWNRRPQLIQVAAEMFSTSGYDGTTVADIAAACGITAASIYRHVDDKETLLVEAIREMVFAAYAAAQVAVDGVTDPSAAVHRLSYALAENAVDRPAIVGLWHREGRYLPRSVREELVGLRNRQLGLWQTQVTRLRPDLTPRQLELRIRAAFGMMNCTPSLPISWGRALYVNTLAAAIRALVLSTDEEEPLPLMVPTRREPPSDRREELIRAATGLFQTHGYHRVAMKDIAAQVGISGPSVYEYFRSKGEILSTILERFETSLQKPTRAEQGDAARLAHLLGRYASCAFTYRDELNIRATESQYLPPDAAKRLDLMVKARRSLIAEAVTRDNPALSGRAAYVCGVAAVESVFAIARSRRFEHDETVPASIVPLAAAVSRTEI